MKLSALLKQVALQRGNAGADGFDPEVSSLHYRSQAVAPGGVFVAIRGETADGHDYIDDALSRGAAAVIAERPVRPDDRIVLVENSRKALACMAAEFYGRPSESMTVIGVTGTNGKTTITYLVENMLAAAGHRVGVIGTVNCRYPGQAVDSKVTTPESLDLQRMLADMKAADVTHVVMEVSSHGVDLHRVASCFFDVGAFTNLTQDHLDYHKTLEAYWACKRRFFTDNLTTGPKKDRAAAVVNMDNGYGRELHAALSASDSLTLIPYGRMTENMVYPVRTALDAAGMKGTIATPAGEIAFTSRLVGEYNLENILCAVAIALSVKLPLSAVCRGIAETRVPGRLEWVEDGDGRMIFVDYAHTPDALENVLGTLKGICRGRLVCVFGCGGDRDRGKRPRMGEIAGRLCDLAVVTSDNPRTEIPEQIIEEIAEGVRRFLPEIPSGSAGERSVERGFMIDSDRANAIRRAIRSTRAGDVVLIAGKGHESYQIIGKDKRHFDDREEAAAALRELRAESIGTKGLTSA